MRTERRVGLQVKCLLNFVQNMKTKSSEQILVTVKMSQWPLLLFYNYIKETDMTPATGVLLQVFRQDIPVVLLNIHIYRKEAEAQSIHNFILRVKTATRFGCTYVAIIRLDI
jgi:hypothetical protein